MNRYPSATEFLSHKRWHKQSRRNRRRRMRTRQRRRRGGRAVRVPFPKWLALYRDVPRRDTLRAIARVQAALTSTSDAVWLDFRSVERLNCDGTLYVCSRLHHLAELFPGRLRFNVPRHPTVDQTFSRVRLYAHLGSRRMVESTHRDVVCWSEVSGMLSDGEALGGLIEPHRTLDERQQALLFRGASEAVANAREHAYETRTPEAMRRWWAFCSVEGGRIFLAITDAGIGIPNTLPQRHGEYLEAIAKALFRGQINHRLPDGELIRAAIDIGRTQTARHHRGKGLWDMCKAVSESERGDLFIYSNRGRLAFRKSAEHREATAVTTYRESIGGTLVTWTVPLPQGAPP